MTPLNPYVLKSYRYLRLVMIGLVILLGVSVLIEVFASGAGCWRTSISSYYWTPVRGVFIASLVAVGACLVIIKGRNGSTLIWMNSRSGRPTEPPLVRATTLLPSPAETIRH